MTLYNFDAGFAAKFRWGEKCQTIRGRRKNRPKVGQMAICYQGLRTKKCRKLGSWFIISVQHVIIYERGISVGRYSVGLDRVPDKWLDAFAQMDGFMEWEELREYFRPRGWPFCGDLIMWHWE